MKTIICTKPGMRRAGVEHPARKDWEDGAFTDEQWEQIKVDPAFVVTEAEAAKPAVDKPAAGKPPQK